MYKLDHLRRLTDSTGLLQHAVYTVPNYSEGYCTDDNARALVLCTLLSELGGDRAGEVQDLAIRYAAFLQHAFNQETGRFRNFLSFDRRWVERAGSEDSHGRALWALGTVVARTDNDGLCRVAAGLFNRALPAVHEFTSPRAWAYSLLGIHECLRCFGADRAALRASDQLLGRLIDLYRENSSPEWKWFESALAYDNARLPHALLLAARRLAPHEAARVGLGALEWLMRVQTAGTDHLVPIGNNGFYACGGQCARFDQQPIEAGSTVSACLEAHRLTGEDRWYEEARRAFDWFLGANDLGLSLYDPRTGGCRDGLMPDGVNQNQGAESTLAFLMSAVELQLSLDLRYAAQTPPEDVVR